LKRLSYSQYVSHILACRTKCTEKDCQELLKLQKVYEENIKNFLTKMPIMASLCKVHNTLKEIDEDFEVFSIPAYKLVYKLITNFLCYFSFLKQKELARKYFLRKALIFDKEETMSGLSRIQKQ